MPTRLPDKATLLARISEAEKVGLLDKDLHPIMEMLAEEISEKELNGNGFLGAVNSVLQKVQQKIWDSERASYPGYTQEYHDLSYAKALFLLRHDVCIQVLYGDETSDCINAIGAVTRMVNKEYYS